MNNMTFYIDDNDVVKLIRYKENDGKFKNDVNILLDKKTSKEYFEQFIYNYPNHTEEETDKFIVFNFFDVDVNLADKMIEQSNRYKKNMNIIPKEEIKQPEIINIEPIKNKINKKKRGKKVFVSTTASLLAALSLFTVSKTKNINVKDALDISNKVKIEQIVQKTNNKFKDSIISIEDKKEIEEEPIKEENTIVKEENKEEKPISEEVIEIFSDLIPSKEEEPTKEIKEYDTLKLSAEDWTNDSKYTTAKAYYFDTITKTANTYGIDPQLALAICTHERGMHNNNVDSGGAIGLFQIQVRGAYAWNEVTAYNFETKQWETVKVDEASVSDVFENIKVGCMIIQNALKEQNYDIPKAIQAYNYGYGNMQTVYTTCMRNENITKEDLSNPYNLSWLNYRNSISGGDPQYLENVFKYIEDGSLLTFNKPNGEIIQFVYDNINQKTL